MKAVVQALGAVLVLAALGLLADLVVTHQSLTIVLAAVLVVLFLLGVAMVALPVQPDFVEQLLGAASKPIAAWRGRRASSQDVPPPGAP